MLPLGDKEFIGCEKGPVCIHLNCPGMTGTRLIKLNVVLTLCQSNFEMLSGALDMQYVVGNQQ